VLVLVLLLCQFYEFYQITIDKWWGRPYLKREFFHRIGEDMGDEVLLVVAQEQGDTVAAALNLIGRCVWRQMTCSCARFLGSLCHGRRGTCKLYLHQATWTVPVDATACL